MTFYTDAISPQRKTTIRENGIIIHGSKLIFQINTIIQAYTAKGLIRPNECVILKLQKWKESVLEDAFQDID